MSWRRHPNVWQSDFNLRPRPHPSSCCVFFVLVLFRLASPPPSSSFSPSPPSKNKCQHSTLAYTEPAKRRSAPQVPTITGGATKAKPEPKLKSLDNVVGDPEPPQGHEVQARRGGPGKWCGGSIRCCFTQSSPPPPKSPTYLVSYSTTSSQTSFFLSHPCALLRPALLCWAGPRWPMFGQLSGHNRPKKYTYIDIQNHTCSCQAILNCCACNA